MSDYKYTSKDLERLWSKIQVKSLDECWEYTGGHIKGYGVIRVLHKNLYVHRLVYQSIYGQIPDGLFVCHSCDNRVCCNPRHFWLGTTQENTRDKVNKGRQHRPKGELSGTHKLTQMQVNSIREIYARKELNQYELAERFGVKQQNISRIVNYKRWT